MTAYIPIVAALVGALAYALASNGKVAELGRILFGAGTFAMLFAMAERTVQLLR